MSEENKPVQAKAEPKKVLESDLIAFKKGANEREKKLREELAEIKVDLAEANSKVKISRVEGEDDEEVRKIKEFLLGEDKRIREGNAKLEQDEASFKEREKEVGAKELATKYGVTVDSIINEPDMEKAALTIYSANLVEEKKKLEERTPESIFENAPGGAVKTQPKDMSPEEFDKFVKVQRDEALSKR